MSWLLVEPVIQANKLNYGHWFNKQWKEVEVQNSNWPKAVVTVACLAAVVIAYVTTGKTGGVVAAIAVILAGTGWKILKKH